jgi:hypothetical protein
MNAPTLIGGGKTVPQTFASYDLVEYADDRVIPLGQYALRAYTPRVNIDAMLEKFPFSFAVYLPMALMAPKLNVKELLSVSKIHGIAQRRGANKAELVQSFDGHDCPACEAYAAVVQPCTVRNGANEIQPQSYRKEYVAKLASSVKPFPLESIRSAINLPVDLEPVFRCRASFVGLEEIAGQPLSGVDDNHLFVSETVPWVTLARKGNKNLASYFAQLHGIPITHRMSKDSIVQEIRDHACVHCRRFSAVFKAMPDKSTKHGVLDPLEAAAQGVAYINSYTEEEEVVYPPSPLSFTDEISIVKDFTDQMRPQNFEESGCAVCGQLTLLKDLTPLDSVDFSLDPLVEQDVARKERSLPIQPLVYDTGPIIDPTCNGVCATCCTDLKKGNRPLKSLANGLWIGAVPPVLSRLTYTEQCLVARVRANRYVMRVSSGHSKMIGNVIAFSMPTVKVYKHLPPTREELSEVLAFIFTGMQSPTENDLSRTPLLV